MTYPSDCDPQVIELLQEIEAMPEGLERVRRCEHAVSVATRLGGFDNEYWTRLYLIDSAYHVPNDPSLLTHYSWLRRALDTAGERLDEEDRRSVLWRLKWALTQVVGTPGDPSGDRPGDHRRRRGGLPRAWGGAATDPSTPCGTRRRDRRAGGGGRALGPMGRRIP